MAVGIRIRGGANQIQISDESPVYMALYSGVLNSTQKITSVPAGGDYWMWQRVYFPAAITTDEPPLVFFNITNRIMIYQFVLLGAPGAWTGFIFKSGIGVNMDLSAVGDWFAASTIVPKSADKVGIRIRNKDTGQVIFDTGYRLVKFQTYLATFRASTSAEYTRWSGYGGGMASAWYVSARPAGCHIMMNSVCGDTSEKAGVSQRAGIEFGFDHSYPNDMYIGTGYADQNAFTRTVMSTYYYGALIFAKLGN